VGGSFRTASSCALAIEDSSTKPEESIPNRHT